MAFLVAQFCATKQRFGITGERSERMIVTHKIKMDLTQWGPPPCIDVVQDDKYSRNIQISLFENGVPYSLPEGCSVQIRYYKEDGVGGVYNTMPNGEDAWNICENRVTVKVAPQVCTAAGNTAVTVTLLHENTELNCFELHLRVQRVRKGVFKSLPYENVRGGGQQADWNAAEGEPGYVLNRTHWAEQALVEPIFDGKLTGREKILADVDVGAYAVRITQQSVTVGELLGAVMVMNMGGEEQSVPLTAEMAMDSNLVLGVPGAVVLQGSDPVVLSLEEDSIIQGAHFAAGTWVMCIPGAFYVKSLSCLRPFEAEIVHKLDKKYLPEFAGSGGGRFIVTIIDNGDGSFSADRTIEELNEAYQSGATLYCAMPDGILLQLAIAIPGVYGFSGVANLSLSSGSPATATAVIMNLDGEVYVSYATQTGVSEEDIPENLPNPQKVQFQKALCATTTNNVNAATVGNFTYDGNNKLFVFGIANPYSLKFTGAATATYDGSKEVTIEIPSAAAGLPDVTADSNGAFLRVVNGVWAVANLEDAEGVAF